MEKTKHLSADEMLNHYWTGTLPVDTVYMTLNSKVRLISTSKVRVCHIEIDEPNDSYIIFVSNRLPREFLYYTVAHCLGHINCGHLEDRRYLNNDQDHIQRFEEEANNYARQLVAPIFALNIFKERNITNPEKIAEAMKITEDIVKKQLAILEKQ